MRESPDSAYLRVLDACLDRAAEGLRTVEDVLRFVSEDRQGREEVRAIRSEMWQSIRSISSGRLLAARDSVSDVGRASSPAEETGGTAVVFRRNIHRAEEALRSIEEILREFDPSVSSTIARLRFRCYDVEKDRYPSVAGYDKKKRLGFSLYVVTGQEQSKGRSHAEVVRKAIEGGAGAIQLREKEMGKRELLEIAKDLRSMTAEAGVTFIVNDYVDLALACGADGVHLGQGDLPVADARRIGGPDLIVGLSTHSVEQAVEGEAIGADYINVGPIYATRTKIHGTPSVGTALITEVLTRVRIPVTCMGGINADNVSEVVEAGADRVAVVSAVVGAEDIVRAARDLLDRIRRARTDRETRSRAGTGDSG